MYKQSLFVYHQVCGKYIGIYLRNRYFFYKETRKEKLVANCLKMYRQFYFFLKHFSIISQLKLLATFQTLISGPYKIRPTFFKRIEIVTYNCSAITFGYRLYPMMFAILYLQTYILYKFEVRIGEVDTVRIGDEDAANGREELS